MAYPLVSARVNPATLRELEKIALECHKTKADLVREAIAAYIGMYLGAKRDAAETG